MLRQAWVAFVLAVVCVSQRPLAGRAARVQPGNRVVVDNGVRGVGRAAVLRGRSTPDFDDGDDSNIQAHWALLVAGSAGWGNYRHQADVMHAYHVLVHGGYKAEHIVIMVADDLADNFENPYPGKVFNRPGGPNVYAGVPIDYRGDDVNAANFVSVLIGDAHAVHGVGTGRVVASGARDRVFVFYSDHGAAGVLGMPSGPFLYADQLIGALRDKQKHRGFHEMVLYIEACESGSMFEGLLGDNAPIYATTAANAYESSWATYCPGFGVQQPPPEMTTCLGDLYSVAWMENSEQSDMTHETLEQQYQLLKERTSANFTYISGSHVMQYGNLDIDAELAGDYMGMHNNGTAPAPSSTWRALRNGHWTLLRDMANKLQGWFGRGTLGSSPGAHGGTLHHKQHDADLLPLRLRAADARAPRTARERAKAALDAVLAARAGVDAAAQNAVMHLLRSAATAPLLLQAVGVSLEGVHATMPPHDTAQGLAMLLSPPEVELVTHAVSGRIGKSPRGSPVVHDWDCLRAMVAAWEAACGGPMDQYAMRHTRLMANLCNAGVQPGDFQSALQGASCAGHGAGRVAPTR